MTDEESKPNIDDNEMTTTSLSLLSVSGDAISNIRITWNSLITSDESNDILHCIKQINSICNNSIRNDNSISNSNNNKKKSNTEKFTDIIMKGISNYDHYYQYNHHHIRFDNI